MWYDRINEIMRKSAQKSALGQRIPESAVTAATAGALETEYNRAFSNAASLRNQEAQAKSQEKTIASNERMAAENVAANERMNTANLSAKERMFNEGLDFSKEQAKSQSISNIAQMGVTAAPKLIEYGKKGWDYITTPSSTKDAISSTEAYQAGPWSSASEATTGTVTDVTYAELAADAVGATVGESAVIGASEAAAGELAGASGIEMAFESSGLFGSLATEASAAASVVESGAVASTVEAAVAGAWQSAALGGAVEGAAVEAAASVAGEGMFSSFLASAGNAISAIGTVVPFVGLAFVAFSFIAPEVTSPIVETVSDVVNTVVDAVTSVFDDSIVCTELARQGYLPYSVLCDENLARMCYVDKIVYDGYIKLFTPIVNKMKTSKIMTLIMRPFGVAVAYELASRVNDKYNGSVLGKIILSLGSPICRLRMVEVY